MANQLIQTPLAIVGMSCCLPGARDLAEFWQLLHGGRDAIQELPPDRLDRSLYYDSEKGRRGKTYSTLGGVIPERDLRYVNAILSAAEQDNWDRCHRILCDVAIEACVESGIDIQDFPWRNTGVYVGHSGGSTLGGELAFRTLIDETLDYLLDDSNFSSLPGHQAEEIIRQTANRLRQGRPERNLDGGPEVQANSAAALISRVLKLNGPHFVIDAACASSLVALSTAALALNRGQVDAAIVGGASFNKADSLILFSHAQSCSARGTRPFDSQADGLISSEGYVALLIKLLPKAIADGDRIHAVIRGIGISSDGRGRSLWAPRKEGQYEAVCRAYGPELDPSDVQWIEAHATSTQVGDATELEALAQFFGPLHPGDKIPIGSVKANIGHTLETAGLAGLTKVVLALQHGEIPPIVKLEQPNTNVDWDQLPFRVPTSVESWRRRLPGKPRCAAVNAFGIGGLNVHLVVQEFIPGQTERRRAGTSIGSVGESPETCQVAIIGRGLVLPQATTIDGFFELVRSGKVVVTDAPRSRWRKKIGVKPGCCEPGSSPIARGGFILDYEYDWKSHKIPPKQIAHANPLQFMLLDAARSALSEAGYAEKDFDRKNTAVVVGNIFGGDFGNDLFVGLRLPEIRRELAHTLQSRGISQQQADRLIEAFENRLLQAKPALLDETGSFTSSTLASRISKTFNLMGGALAIDAGDCSSFAALSVACDLLQSGTHSLVLCAAAQRAMDLPAFESMALHGRLRTESTVPNSGYLPGEGVAAVLLKRLDAALRDGDPILGVIQCVAGAMDAADLSRAVELAAERVLSKVLLPSTKSHSQSTTDNRVRLEYGCGIPALDDAERRGLNAAFQMVVPAASPTLIHQMGHTQAVHGMAMLLKATLPGASVNTGISIHASSGLAYQVLMSPAPNRLADTAAEVPVTESQAAAPVVQTPLIYSTSAMTVEQLIADVQGGALDTLTIEQLTSSSFDPSHPARMAVVAESAQELKVKLSLAKQLSGQSTAAGLLAEKGIFLHERFERPLRIALAFPGQGSQYPGMLRSLVDTSPAVAAAMRQADEELSKLNLGSCAELLWGSSERLGSNLWVTQVAVLLADFLALAASRDLGITPYCVIGHSFGEFAALIAAESLTIRQAIELTRERTRAIESATIPASKMLSINASPEQLQAFLEAFRGRVFLSHHNAPEQTVVGGFEDAIVEFESKLSSEKIASRRLNVPIAFHTPLLEIALRSWEASLRRAQILPPRIPILSSVTNKYVSDPGDMCDNLVSQLVTPVRYVDLVNKLVRSGVDVILEVGPQLVLTRLHRRILRDSRVISMGIDHQNRPGLEQQCHVIAELECLGWERLTTSEPLRLSPPVTRHPITFFDATENRKKRRQGQRRNKADSLPLLEPVPVFDATKERRERHGSRAASNPEQRDQAFASPLPEAPSAHVFADAARSPTPSIPLTDLEQVLREFVMDQTGYPPDLINFDWDLEADLGIDSIKRAQLFGELREMFRLDTSDRTSLESVRTLRQIANLLREQIAHASEPANAEISDLARTLAPEKSVVSVAVPSLTGRPEPSHETLEKFLVDFVVEQTGYPPEIVDLDADFEADLGIDSIKKSQLFGELREQFQLKLVDSDRSTLNDYRTLRHVLVALRENGSSKLPAEMHAEICLECSPSESSTDRSAPVDHLPVAQHVDALTAKPRNGNEKKLPFTDFVKDSRYLLGLERGRQHAVTIRSLLRQSADQFLDEGGAISTATTAASFNARYTAGDLNELRGVADGAGVHVDNILAYQRRNAEDAEGILLVPGQSSPCVCEDVDRRDARPQVTHRYVLRLVPSPSQGNTKSPDWHGAAVILGDNDLADAIRERLQQEGRQAFIIPATEDASAAIQQLEQIWQEAPAPHLFIVTPRDADAMTTWSSEAFVTRRRKGVSTLFQFCQRWVKLAIDSGLMNSASLVGVTSLGGDFGLSGNIDSVESGAVTGLLKAILIESWVGGNRTLPIKIIDTAADTPTNVIIDSIWRELATPSYDTEVAINSTGRYVIRAHRQCVQHMPRQEVQRGGTWVCTGGARGITAFAARELARRFDCRLHLLGLAPLPQIPEHWRALSPDDLTQLRFDVMRSARESGQNAIKEWEQVEKAMEIDRTLKELRSLGISAHYHSCDVADRHSLAAVLDAIRKIDGPITGILHGAGVGKDARFERKEIGRVEECLRAKVDGARLLMELTRNDPLKYFVAFGSISGRFGANGHTDYSLANDMLCKEVDWFRLQRPEVKSVAFHWHAWDDVGMATKPETKLALEMVGMQFMPAREGVRHLIDELEAETPDSEILITDDKYYRLFYPAESLVPTDSNSREGSQVSLLEGAHTVQHADRWTTEIQLDPTVEPFLFEHRLDDRPVLPIVVGMELLSEAAVRSGIPGRVVALHNVEALSGLRFHTDRPINVRLHVVNRESPRLDCELTADFHARNGQLVEADKCYLRAEVELGTKRSSSSTAARTELRAGWTPVQYAPRGSKMYLGPPLQCLRNIHVEHNMAWGKIIAPALIELSGAHRSVQGWMIPSAAIDACLYATGLLCWTSVEPGPTLPVRIGKIEFGRLPHPGEACLVEARFLRRDGRCAVFEFTLFGNNGDVLVRAQDYHVAWISA